MAPRALLSPVEGGGGEGGGGEEDRPGEGEDRGVGRERDEFSLQMED